MIFSRHHFHTMRVSLNLYLINFENYIVFDPVVSNLYRYPAAFGSTAQASNSWELDQLLAIDSLFIPENYSRVLGIPNCSDQELRFRVGRIRAPAVISHVSAARVFGLPLPYRVAVDPRLHVTVSRSRARSQLAGIHSHLGDLIAEEIVVVNGLSITSPARIVADLAGVLNLSELNVLFDAAQAPHIDALCDLGVEQEDIKIHHSSFMQPFHNSTKAQSESEFVKIILRRKRFAGRSHVTRILSLRDQHLLPYSDIPWQSFVAATIASNYNASISLLSPEQLAVPAHNVIIVKPWHFSDDRETSMSIASTITALRSFGWCADSFSYRELLSVDSLLQLYAKSRNRSEFAHMRLYSQRSRRR